MKKFKPDIEAIPEGSTVKTYDEILEGLRQDLIQVHEYSCASGDMIDSLGKLTEGQLARILATNGDVNHQMMVVLEEMLSMLNAVSKNADLVLLQTVKAKKAQSYTRSWKSNSLWIAVGAVLVLVIMGAGWVGGVRAGASVGYSRAFDDLAAGGMIEMKRHGDKVDLMMGPNNPAGGDTPAETKPTMTLDASKVPELR